GWGGGAGDGRAGLPARAERGGAAPLGPPPRPLTGGETSMIAGVPAETAPGERRVALTPDAVKALVKDGIQVAVQAGAGAAAGFADAQYSEAGARVAPGAAESLAADLVLKVAPPSDAEIAALRDGAAYIGFLRPLDAPAVARRLAERRSTAF